MRFGLTILPEHTWPAAEPLWREAEALGFDHAWTFDHVTWGGLPDSPWFAALPTLAFPVTASFGVATCPDDAADAGALLAAADAASYAAKRAGRDRVRAAAGG